MTSAVAGDLNSGAILDCRRVALLLLPQSVTIALTGTSAACSAWVWVKASGGCSLRPATRAPATHAPARCPEPPTSPFSVASSPMAASCGRVTARPSSPPAPSSTARASRAAPCCATAAARGSPPPRCSAHHLRVDTSSPAQAPFLRRATFVDCSFLYNRATRGGAIYAALASSVTVTNSIFKNNR